MVFWDVPCTLERYLNIKVAYHFIAPNLSFVSPPLSLICPLNFWLHNNIVAHVPPETVVSLNLLKPTGHVMHQQFNMQQLYVLPTLYLCVFCLSDNKQRLVPLTA